MMGDISLIEWIVYGFFAYSSALMLIISTIKEVPTGRSSTLMRSIWMVPGAISASILSSSGIKIIFPTTTFNGTTVALNVSDWFNETSVTQSYIVLQNPVWMIFHLMLFFVLLVYIITQIVSMFESR